NGVVHLAAIAGRVGLRLDLTRLNELSDTTPVLAAVKPVGDTYYMEDFFAAGGIGAVLRELKPLLNLDCMTITGETLGERLAAEEGHY
ncbi:dihydroxy-acid dehydratase domain-containing protein, partial [Streptomyces niveiscabiei]|uniref:dihydroxy-acid dehydratase domain-containing protein n=1 Tax=Streptomyces niveiscabiei TaxID=164115 RepID=UPI0038F6AB18